MRFEQLEERLKKLEVIALTSTGRQEAEEVLEKAKDQRIRPAKSHAVSTPPAGKGPDESRRSSEADDVMIRAMDQNLAPDAERPIEAWRAELELLQARVVEECGKRLSQLIQATVEEGRRRLRALADEMTPLLQPSVEKALQKSAGIVVSQVTGLLEQEIQIATRRSLYATLGCAKTGSENIPAEGAAHNHHKDGVVAEQDDKMDRRKFEQDLSAALEGIRKQSAAFLESLNSQMQRALATFEENTSKQMATGFQQIARELYERGLETPGQRPDTSNPTSQRNGEAAGLQGGDVAQQEPVVKSQKKESTWRILGLT